MPIEFLKKKKKCVLVNSTEGGGGSRLTGLLSSDAANDRPARPAGCLQSHTASPAPVPLIDQWKDSCGVLAGDETQSAGVAQLCLLSLFVSEIDTL